MYSSSVFTVLAWVLKSVMSSPLALVALLSLGTAFAFAPSASADVGAMSCRKQLERSGFDVGSSEKVEWKGQPAYRFSAVGPSTHSVWGRGEFAWEVFADLNCVILEQRETVQILAFSCCL